MNGLIWFAEGVRVNGPGGGGAAPPPLPPHTQPAPQLITHIRDSSEGRHYGFEQTAKASSKPWEQMGFAGPRRSIYSFMDFFKTIKVN